MTDDPRVMMTFTAEGVPIVPPDHGCPYCGCSILDCSNHQVTLIVGGFVLTCPHPAARYAG